jgi:large subunit ribosomal protein L4
MFMKAKVYRQDGTVKGEVELPSSVFAAEIKGHLLYQMIKGYLANHRQGTSKTKGRSEVSGGGRKPWRQKGTGRARAGSNTSPVWARGGKAHGPDPRDYTTRLPKALRKQALAAALSSRAKDEKVIVVDAISCEPAKTKTMARMLSVLSLTGRRTLLIVEKNGTGIYRAGRNIADLAIKPLAEITAYDILNSENIIFAGENLVGKLNEAARS